MQPFMSARDQAKGLSKDEKAPRNLTLPRIPPNAGPLKAMGPMLALSEIRQLFEVP
jgi:hypothetical protein